MFRIYQKSTIMKSRFHTLKLLGWLLAAGLVSGQAMAQSTAIGTATASATILRPITITKATDMNFGNVVTSSAAGTVVLLPDGTRSRTAGSTFIPSNPGTVTAAAFTINGEGAATYSVTLPLSVSLTGGTGTAMTVATFTSTPGTVAGAGTLNGSAGTADTASTAGTQTLLVGGTLAVGATQEAGVYKGDFDVTVAYN